MFVAREQRSFKNHCQGPLILGYLTWVPELVFLDRVPLPFWFTLPES